MQSARMDRSALPPLKERMRLYQPNVVQTILLEAKNMQTTQGDSRADSRMSRDTPYSRTSGKVESDDFPGVGGGSDVAVDRAAAQREAREKEKRQRDEEFRKARERKLQESNRRKEAEFQKTYKSVLQGLQHDEGITGEMQDVLDQSDKVKSRKKRQLYQDWETGVFETIQNRIQSALAKRTPRSIERRLKSQYDAYIKTTNEKLAVFRDVIIEKDYDPLSAHKSSIKFQTDDLDDPCLQGTLKTLREQQAMGIYDASLNGTLPGKVTFSTVMWDKVESTPYGHCMDTSGNYMWKPASEAERANRKSHIHLNHYNVPRGRDVMMIECPKGRAPAEGLDARKKRAGENMFYVVQQSKRAPAVADLGTGMKRMVPGPDKFQDRRGLYEILQQTCKSVSSQPSAKGQVGDLWLDSKGKRWLPGVEDRLGRRDLFEALHRGRPSEEGSTAGPTGDIWLDKKGKTFLQCAGDHNMWQILQTPMAVAPPDVIWVGQRYLSNVEQNIAGITGR